ncbi:MAG: MFS transporter [Candidatus Thorarchaeota archaeon]
MELASQKTYKNFYVFLLGQQFSLLGSSLVFFVITWWITIETNNPFILSLASVLYFIPQIAIAPIAGVLSDRMNRKLIIISIDAIQALVTLILFLLFWLNITDIWTVLFVNTIRSILQAFHVPTYNAIVPSMVPKNRLTRVNGLSSLSSSLVFLIGPILGGTLFELFQRDIKSILLIDIFTFFLALLPLLFISIPKTRQKHIEKEKPSFLKDFKIGVTTLKTVPGLLSLILLATIFNFLMRPFTELLPYFIYDIHDGTALELAFVVAFISVANIVGGFINSLRKNWIHKTTIIMSCSIGLLIGYSFLLFTPYRLFFLMGIGLFIQGISFSFIINNYMTILQSAVPHDKVGRIVSIDQFLTFAFMPLGSIVSGILATVIGIYSLYLIFIIFGMATAILVWIFTDINKLDHIGKIEEIVSP